MNPTAAATSTSINQDQFLQLLVAQLQNQDPLTPTDSTTFITQLAQFTQLEQTQRQTATFDQVLKLQQLTSGSALIGKTVEYTPTNGSAQTGVVSAAAIQPDGSVALSIGGVAVPLDQVTQVR
jgi:flagellar basal-body rod modification protein FlgD